MLAGLLTYRHLPQDQPQLGCSSRACWLRTAYGSCWTYGLRAPHLSLCLYARSAPRFGVLCNAAHWLPCGQVVTAMASCSAHSSCFHVCYKCDRCRGRCVAMLRSTTAMPPVWHHKVTAGGCSSGLLAHCAVQMPAHDLQAPPVLMPAVTSRAQHVRSIRAPASAGTVCWSALRMCSDKNCVS